MADYFSQIFKKHIFFKPRSLRKKWFTRQQTLNKYGWSPSAPGEQYFLVTSFPSQFVCMTHQNRGSKL